MASHIVKPKFPPNGSSGIEVAAQLPSIKLDSSPASRTHTTFLAIAPTVTRWRFQPYIKNGKPQYFHADVSFRLN